MQALLAVPFLLSMLDADLQQSDRASRLNEAWRYAERYDAESRDDLYVDIHPTS